MSIAGGPQFQYSLPACLNNFGEEIIAVDGRVMALNVLVPRECSTSM